MAPPALSLYVARRVKVGLYRQGSGWRLRLGVWNAGPAHAVLAIDEQGRVLGCLAYKPTGLRLRSYLTFVARRARGLGLGAALWAMVLELEAPRSVTVRVISDNGLTLMRRVEAEHPRVSFLIREDGERKLRDKRKGKPCR